MDLVGSTARKNGTRGGRDQFSWDKVKDDKYYHNYLGHSVKAPRSARKGEVATDPLWYAKAPTSSSAAQAGNESFVDEERESKRRRRSTEPDVRSSTCTAGTTRKKSNSNNGKAMNKRAQRLQRVRAGIKEAKLVEEPEHPKAPLDGELKES
mmetsp:Transcript_2080/g.4610  ORF Transcript_2080/g.4610 Transcript_2080/m.4610 type:complete len:152 (-) Transcript_2080:2054-2509(-)